jgi:hypothetical protein
MSPAELEESQRPDAMRFAPEPPAVEPPGLEQKTDVRQQFTRYRIKVLVYCGTV